MGLDKLADQQMKILTTIGQYVAQQKMRVANCSFGTSMPQARMIMRQLLPMVLQRDPTNEEVETYAKYFINKVIEKGKGFVDAAKDTFFVIAAGNDGLNNDEYPVSPANIKQNNTITVAATFEHKKIASFSNYGINMVDVAAPGVGINSTIPGNEYLRVSGTSQATPYVAGVIGQLMDINPKLSFSDIRTIVMLTVDKKDYLASKVKAGGIINSERAKEAAKLSLGMSLDTAIEKARATVLDEMVVNSIKKEGFVIPLTPMFILR
jgi:hypothetical protein